MPASRNARGMSTSSKFGLKLLSLRLAFPDSTPSKSQFTCSALPTSYLYLVFFASRAVASCRGSMFPRTSRSRSRCRDGHESAVLYHTPSCVHPRPSQRGPTPSLDGPHHSLFQGILIRFVYFIPAKQLREVGLGLTLLVSPLLASCPTKSPSRTHRASPPRPSTPTTRTVRAQVKEPVRLDRVDILLISPERIVNERRSALHLALRHGFPPTTTAAVLATETREIYAYD